MSSDLGRCSARSPPACSSTAASFGVALTVSAAVRRRLRTARPAGPADCRTWAVGRAGADAPPRRAGRPPGRRAGRGAARAAGRPVRARGRRRAGQGRRALADPAAVRRSSARRRRRRRRGEHRLPQPDPAGRRGGRRGERHRGRRRPVGAAAGAVAAARASSTAASASRGARVLAGHLGRRRRQTTGAGRRYAAAEHLRDLFRSLRRAPARRCSSTGRRATTPTAPARRCDDDLRWQAELWRRLRDRARRAEPGRAARRHLRAAARRPGRQRPAGAAVAVRRRPG